RVLCRCAVSAGISNMDTLCAHFFARSLLECGVAGGALFRGRRGVGLRVCGANGLWRWVAVGPGGCGDRPARREASGPAPGGLRLRGGNGPWFRWRLLENSRRRGSLAAERVPVSVGALSVDEVGLGAGSKGVSVL